MRFSQLFVDLGLKQVRKVSLIKIRYSNLFSFNLVFLHSSGNDSISIDFFIFNQLFKEANVRSGTGAQRFKVTESVLKGVILVLDQICCDID